MAAVGLRDSGEGSPGCSGSNGRRSSSEATGWDMATARLRAPDVALKASACLPDAVLAAANGSPACKFWIYAEFFLKAPLEGNGNSDVGRLMSACCQEFT